MESQISRLKYEIALYEKWGNESQATNIIIQGVKYRNYWAWRAETAQKALDRYEKVYFQL